MPIILQNTSFTYAINTPFQKKALENINLEINKGELWLLVGHTGSGKTTLMSLMNGLLLPQEGNVIVEGMSTKDKKVNIKEIRKKIGIVFQYPESQFFQPTIKDEIIFAPKNFNYEINEEMLKYYLELVNLPESYLEKNPFELSGGEMRKVAIISVLSYNPDYIIFDEPTVGLDYTTKKSIFNLIKELLNLGKTVILSTHWINEFVSLKPNILMLKNGEISFKGEFDDFALLDDKVLLEAGIVFDEKLKLYRCALKKGKIDFAQKISLL
ncbi:ABC transporter [Petrotoga sp. 9PW.55.5.1]|uniref:ATP-binding cassette domain-containing protein n=1 Tax=Petrotoga sp. 9PW.55.5.1 TaxID=1308979 RepID=UPI000DC59B60|nr:ATP-binding cassette domain-containing protein [Petrotoga sp. 9PW.55.5.1]RAO99556.1 ABC transporter [Petrotoga sp. 9PW.55.5.1]